MNKDIKEQIDELLALLAKPENVKKLIELYNEKDEDVEKEVLVVGAIAQTKETEDTIEDAIKALEDECEDDDNHDCHECLGCQMGAFVETHPEYKERAEEIFSQFNDEDWEEKHPWDILNGYLQAWRAEVAIKLSKEKQTCDTGPCNENKPVTEPRKQEEMVRSVPWGKNNPSELTSHIQTSMNESNQNESNQDKQKSYRWITEEIEKTQLRIARDACREYATTLEKIIQEITGVDVSQLSK